MLLLANLSALCLETNILNSYLQLPGFPDHYLMQKNDQEVSMRDESPHHTKNLRGQSRVKGWQHLWGQNI